MKTKILLIFILTICLLCACASQKPIPEAPASTPAASEQPAPERPTPTAEPESPPAPELTPSPEPISTPSPSPDPVLREVPYIEIVKDPNQPIYSGPGYDFEKVGIVEIATGYTIVEESIDYEGNLWGRLKSGAGWIDLSDSRAFDGITALVTASYVQGLEPEGTDYYVPDGGDYYNFIEFNVKVSVSDVQLLALQFTSDDMPGNFGEFYSVSETLHTLPSLEPEQSYIVALIFPGDLSAYGLRFTDENGLVHEYLLSISLRNGELVLNELPQ